MCRRDHLRSGTAAPLPSSNPRNTPAHLCDQLSHAAKAADDDVAAHAAHLALLGLHTGTVLRGKQGEEGLLGVVGGSRGSWQQVLWPAQDANESMRPTCSAFMSLFSSICPSLPPNWARKGVSAMLRAGGGWEAGRGRCMVLMRGGEQGTGGGLAPCSWQV